MAKHKKKVHDDVSAKEKKSKKESNVGMLAGVAIIILVIGIGAFYYGKSQTPDTTDPETLISLDPLDEKNPSDPKTATTTTTTTTATTANLDSVKVDFYVMSQCPFGTQVVDVIAPVKEKLGDELDLNIEYILYPQTQYAGREAQYCVDELCSMHGIPEVQGNIVQLCAIKHEPEDHMKMLTCQNKDAKNIPDNWEQCARLNGLDIEKIKSCYEGDEGKELLRASSAKANEVKATGSPTIYLAGEKYSGGRTENDFMRAICNAYEGEKPEECADIPEPTKVTAMFINDKRCDTCDISKLVGQLKGLFPGLDATEYDYSETEGKKIFEDAGLTLLPAVLFDESVKDDPNYANVQSYIVEAGDHLSLRIGASFDPEAEICNNNIDDTGNGKVDCDDDTCVNTMECREEIENHLQVFVMSDCPYGREGIKALKGAVDNFGDAIDYEVHYIANEAGDGFNSLHGQYEVDENIIQLCVLEHSPAVWLDYIYCRSDKGVRGIEWTGCAEEVGVAAEKVQACFDGDEGKDLLREDIKIAGGLGIGASPTWLANNKYKFSGIDAETVKQNFCKYNEGAEGCENTLSSESDVAAGSCG